MKRRGHAPVLADAHKKDRDPLATPQSPLTQLSDEQLAEAIATQQRRASPSASALPDAGAQNHAPQRAAKAQPASRAAKKQNQK